MTADRYWLDPERLHDLYKQHGSLAAVGRAMNGPTKETLGKWWRHHGFDELPRGPKAGSTARPPGAPVDEAEILRERVRELEAQVKQARAADVHTERVVQAIERNARTLTTRPVPRRTRATRTVANEQTFVALLSDLHAGETVRAERTLGAGGYDWEIMLGRLDRYVQSILSHRHHFAAPIRRLVMPWLGDFTTGEIHEELALTNDRNGAEIVAQLGYDLAERVVLPLAEAFETVEIDCVPGNHGRLSRKPQPKRPTFSGDWLAYKFAEAVTRPQRNVTWAIPDAGMQMRLVYGWRCLLMHGDGIRSSMPGVPWGGVSRRSASLQEQAVAVGTPFDYLFCGHFHTANALDGVTAEVVMNGSTKGVDEYSLSAFGGGRGAKQRLLSMHPDHGITAAFWIDLEERERLPLSERVRRAA